MKTPFPKLFDLDATELSPSLDEKPKMVNHLEVVNAKFPRVAEAIKLLWGTPELHQYLTKLIVDDRHYKTGETRQGFPQDVMASLLVIYNKHTEGAPISDIWHNAQ